MTKFDSDVPGANPRSAIGYYEPGHYLFVLVDGRQANYSKGMTLTELSQIFEDRGCKVAYNFDGGYSALMYFNGDVYSKPAQGGREVSDIVYIGEALLEDGTGEE